MTQISLESIEKNANYFIPCIQFYLITYCDFSNFSLKFGSPCDWNNKEYSRKLAP